MGCLAVDSAMQTRAVSLKSDALRKQSMDRDALLDQLRTDIYRSATLTRDYLLEHDDTVANSQRAELQQLETYIKKVLNQYSEIAPAEESNALQNLKLRAETYWTSLGPALNWTHSARAEQGEAFLRNTVIPRRDEVVQFVKQVNMLDEQTTLAADDQIQEVQERFQGRVRTLSVLGLVLGVILAVIVIRHVKHLARDANASFSAVLAAREDLRRLSDRLVAVQEEERRNLSRELHDDLGQAMSAILLEVRKLESAASGIGRDRLTAVRRLVEENVAKVRNMALLLRPGMLDELGLVPALRWQVKEVSRRTGLKVKMLADEIDDDLPDSTRTCIYRVVQEALNNCVKHSGAGEVRVALRSENRGLAVSVQDDGVGFDPARNKGLGLLGIMERVNRAGGRFHVDSKAGSGTILSVFLPFEGDRRLPKKELLV
jgi:signal transduction histidine kinase